jgi:outer membrane protein assembly factor BamB
VDELAPSSQFAVRVPGEDDTPQTAAASDERELVAGQPVAGPGIPADVTGDWPGFRGPRRDAICEAGAPLLRQLPPAGRPCCGRSTWKRALPAPRFADGRVFVLDYDKQAQADTLRCLSLSDGREIWRNSYPVSISPNHGITRTVPALHDDVVITIGPRCHVACWDMETGRNRWLFSMVQRYGSEERQWYTGQCPLVDGDRVILAPCGPDSLLVALDYRTGEEIWRTPNPRGWKMTHSSVMPVEFAGQRMYVYCGTGGTAGVSAEDGRLLWDETSWTRKLCDQPVAAGPAGRTDFPQQRLRCGRSDVAAIEAAGRCDRRRSGRQAGPRAVQFRTADAHFLPGACVRHPQVPRRPVRLLGPARQRIWNSGQDKFGHGPYVIADDMLLIFGDDGVLVAAEATPEAYRPLWRMAVYDRGTKRGGRWPSPRGSDRARHDSNDLSGSAPRWRLKARER